MCIEESFDTIFNMDYESGKSAMDERVKLKFCYTWHCIKMDNILEIYARTSFVSSSQLTKLSCPPHNDRLTSDKQMIRYKMASISGPEVEHAQIEHMNQQIFHSNKI